MPLPRPFNPFANIVNVATVVAFAAMPLWGCGNSDSNPSDAADEDALAPALDAAASDARADASTSLSDAGSADAGMTSDGPAADATTDGSATAPFYVCPTSGATLTDLQRCTSAPQYLGSVGAGPVLGDILQAALSPDRQSLLVITHLPQLQDDELSLFKVDLRSGDRTLVSGYNEQQTKVGAGPDLGGSIRITVAGTVFVNSSQQLLKVDLGSGNRTVHATWTGRSDLCRAVDGAFDVAGESLFYFGHSTLNSRGWLRYDAATDKCEAFSWCRMGTPGAGGGEGPCPGAAPRPLLHEGHLWSTDFLRGALFKVNPNSGLRQFASRTTNDPALNVGTGSGCLRVPAAQDDGSTIAYANGKLWISGDVVDVQDCERGNVDMVAVDPQTGARTSAFASAGPLSGVAGEEVGWMAAAPGKPGVLLVAASRGIAFYDPATQLSVYLSR